MKEKHNYPHAEPYSYSLLQIRKNFKSGTNKTGPTLSVYQSKS